MNSKPEMSYFRTAQAMAAKPACSAYVGQCLTHVHHGSKRHGVLFLNPWGIDELASRKPFRMLAETLSAKGYPAVRFDYPGTCDAGPYLSSESFLCASQSILKDFIASSGLSSVTLIAQGIGCLIAQELMRADLGVRSAVLLAPPKSGKAFLRELKAWARFTAAGFQDGWSGPNGALRAAGFNLPSDVQQEISGLDASGQGIPSPVRILLPKRDNNAGDESVAEALRGAGHDVETCPFDGHAEYACDPTLSVFPQTLFQGIVNWIEKTQSCTGASAGLEQDLARGSERQSTLTIGEITEQPVRFGPQQDLFAVYTKHRTDKPDCAVLFLNSGYDHHIGWGGCHVSYARFLAGTGVACLRLDGSGIGESRYHPGQPPQVLYSDSQIEDVAAACDYLVQKGIRKIVVYGRCSGAYLGFMAAAQLKDVSGVFIVNPRRFAWDPRQSVDVEVRRPVQPLENYARKMLDWATLRRSLAGSRAFVSGVSKLARGLMRPLRRKIEKRLGMLTVSGRLVRLVDQRMKKITHRPANIHIVFSEQDAGLTELEYYFGPRGAKLKKYPRTEITFVPGADHNLTSEAASKMALESLAAFTRKIAVETGKPVDRDI